MTDEITQETLKELIRYEPDTGVLAWKHRDRKWFDTGCSMSSWNYRFAGKVAGGKIPSGYILITILKKRYYAHRLIWFYLHGKWPANQMDHLNHDRTDNRIVNLREASRLQNSPL